MLPDLAVSPDIFSLKKMENMNAGFVAEGLTSRKRAIDRYMKTKGTKDDKHALKFLQDIGGLTSPENDRRPPTLLCKITHEGLKKLRDLVVVVDDQPKLSDASPLVLYAMALCALEPRYGMYNPDLGWDCLLEALDKGCDPARALYADMALRAPLSPGDEDVRETLQEFLEEALEAMNKDIFEPRDEDLLLVMGRRFALNDTGETLLSYLVRKGLVLLARADHVDAVRLLALDHAREPSPETLWAREEIKSQAKRGRAHAMLVMGQHLSVSLPFWIPEGGLYENLTMARDLLGKRARKNDPWATLTLAWTAMSSSGRAAIVGDEIVCQISNQEYKRAMQMLETLAREKNFAPAKALLGVWYFTFQQDPETAWPLLRDACAQMVSRQCEAACADFLLSLIINSLYVETVRAQGHDLEDLDDDHGGTDLWCRKRLAEVVQYDRFGLLMLAVQRLSLMGASQDGWYDGLELPDDLKNVDGLSESEKRKIMHALTSVLFGGRLTIHFSLVLLSLANTPTAQIARDHVEARIRADMADGNEDCIMADILFTKRLFDANPCDATELEKKCLALSGGSNIARVVVNLLHLHLLFELKEDDNEDDNEDDDIRIEKEMMVLETEYRRALHTIDLPVACAMPVIFKYARSQFSPTVVRKCIEFVTGHLFDGRRDLKGLVARITTMPWTHEIDMNRLWENLGLVPHVDFAPHTMSAGDGTSRSQGSAGAGKNARRRRDKLRKERLRKARSQKR